MKDTIHILLPLLAVCLAFVACSRPAEKSRTGAAAANQPAQPQRQSDMRSRQQTTQQQAHPEIEEERKNSQQEADKPLIRMLSQPFRHSQNS
jgi:hypothetical protein